MAIEIASMRELQKPWGVTDPRPWSDAHHAGLSIGELCYERSSVGACEPALLLKVLLTSQPLSIQVHPDDSFAQKIGLPHGKTEAWYVLAAQPGAAVAVGLKHSMTPQQLRNAVLDGAIDSLVAWRTVVAGDTVFVPAGTVHAIGPGLVIAEIQQRSDATFRLFDYGRNRALHIDQAVAAARTVPVDPELPPIHLANGRTLLVSNPYFVFERLELEPNSSWRLDASRETWLLVVNGSACAGDFDVVRGEVVFAQGESVAFRVGELGAVCLVAYTGRGGPDSQFLRRGEEPFTNAARHQNDAAPAGTPIGANR